MEKVGWFIAVSRKETKCDTLWKSTDGRFCITDGTHPAHLEGDIEDYILRVEALVEPLRIRDSEYPIAFPCGGDRRPIGQSVEATRVLERFFLKEGVITKPLTYTVEVK